MTAPKPEGFDARAFAERLDGVALMLEDLGRDVVTAAAGAQALEKLAAGMDGYELIERARDRRLRVLACSGYPNFERGMPIIRKPFTQEALARAMAKATGLC